MIDFNTQNFILIYKGAYDYFQLKRKYAEETFEIYKDPQNHILTFKTEVSGREGAASVGAPAVKRRGPQAPGCMVP